VFLTDDNPEHQPSADAVVFSPDGKTIAWMAAAAGFRQLWGADTGL